MKGDPLNNRILSGSGQIFQDFQRGYALEGQRRWLVVGEVSRVVDCERRSVKSRDSVGIWSDFQDFQRVYALEGQRRWLEVGQVSRVVDLERRSVQYQDFVGIWLDFSGLPRGLCFWKVREGGWRSKRSQGEWTLKGDP